MRDCGNCKYWHVSKDKEDYCEMGWPIYMIADSDEDCGDWVFEDVPEPEVTFRVVLNSAKMYRTNQCVSGVAEFINRLLHENVSDVAREIEFEIFDGRSE